MISIGIFDGVHRGHAAIFQRVRERAVEMAGESVIVTFWPHPRLVLGKESDRLRFLSSLDDKKALINRHGIDHLVIIHFTREFSLLPACEFVRQYLVEGTGLKHLVFGFDHHFGHKREGNFENLKDCAGQYRFTIEQLDPVMKGEFRISSSAIRDLLLAGHVRLAKELLSYPYCLEGKITGGRQVGRAIGFPTANILVDDEHKLIPADGVYAVEVTVDQKVYMGMMNIGFRPTLNSDKADKTLEVHIMDFDADLYDRNIVIRFIERIRDEQHFGTLDQLRKQLEQDKADAVRILSGA